MTYTVRGRKGAAKTFKVRFRCLCAGGTRPAATTTIPQVTKGARRANKAVRGVAAGVRKDLVKAAVARASCISKAIVKGAKKN